MKLSGLLQAEIPAAVFTETATVPPPAGKRAMTASAETTLNRAVRVPKRALSTSSNHLPLMTMAVPPAIGPAAGDRLVSVGLFAAVGRGGLAVPVVVVVPGVPVPAVPVPAVPLPEVLVPEVVVPEVVVVVAAAALTVTVPAT